MIISGTIHNAVKLNELNSKWQQKKNNFTSNKKNDELTPEERQLKLYQEDMDRIREDNEKNQVINRARSGAELTSEELDYLKENSPEVYQEYLQDKEERRAYEKQLKNCKTKEEAERLKLQKSGQFMAESKKITTNPYIPKSKKLELIQRLQGRVSGFEKIYSEFIKSRVYIDLPSEEDESRKRAKKAAEIMEITDVAVEKVPEDIDKNVSEAGDILPEAADIISEAAKEAEVLENTKKQ